MLQLKLAIGDWVYVNIIGHGLLLSGKGYNFVAQVAPSSVLKGGDAKYELPREVASQLTKNKAEVYLSPIALQECREFSGVTFRREDKESFRDYPFEEKLEQQMIRNAFKEKLCFMGEVYRVDCYRVQTTFKIVGTNSLESDLQNLGFLDSDVKDFSCGDARSKYNTNSSLDGQTTSDKIDYLGRAETFFHRPEFGFCSANTDISLLYDFNPQCFDSNFGEEQMKKRGFVKFGGYQSLKDRLRKEIVTNIVPGDKPNLRVSNLLSKDKIVTGIVIHGCTGVGKSLLAKLIVEELKIDPQLVFTEIPTGSKRTHHANLISKPCVYILDDLQFKMLGSGQKLGADQNLSEKLFPADIRKFFDKLRFRVQNKVFVIGICSDIEMLDIALRRDGYFELEYEIPAPSQKDRSSILNILVEKSFSHLSLKPEDMQEISERTHGYTASDLISLLKRVSSEMQDGSFEAGTWKDVIAKVRPSAMKEIVLDIPKVRWTDIGGQNELKQVLKQCIEWPIQKPELFRSFNIKPPRGILLYGPPGCSKTMIAKAIATETGLNFLSVKGPEIFDKYVGQSEKSIRKLFQKARLAAPVIIFFDEIDAIAPARGNSSTNSVSDRVLTQLLSELDGIEKLDDVTIVAATNRPDIIDPALLRPGRIDKLIYVPLPDQETRRQIIDLKLKKLPTSNEAENSIDVEGLVSRTLGFSGAEVCALCDEAAMLALVRSTMESTPNDKTFIIGSDFEQAFQKVKPLTDERTWKKLENFATGR